MVRTTSVFARTLPGSLDRAARNALSVSDGWTKEASRVGANRFISLFQFDKRDAGSTSRDALQDGLFYFRTSRSDRTWIVLNKPRR